MSLQLAADRTNQECDGLISESGFADPNYQIVECVEGSFQGNGTFTPRAASPTSTNGWSWWTVSILVCGILLLFAVCGFAVIWCLKEQKRRKAASEVVAAPRRGWSESTKNFFMAWRDQHSGTQSLSPRWKGIEHDEGTQSDTLEQQRQGEDELFEFNP